MVAPNLVHPDLERGGCLTLKRAMAKLYFHYSTMNAGKSTVLLQAAHNYVSDAAWCLILMTAKFVQSRGRRAHRDLRTARA